MVVFALSLCQLAVQGKLRFVTLSVMGSGEFALNLVNLLLEVRLRFVTLLVSILRSFTPDSLDCHSCTCFFISK